MVPCYDHLAHITCGLSELTTIILESQRTYLEVNHFFFFLPLQTTMHYIYMCIRIKLAGIENGTGSGPATLGRCDTLEAS